jgi:N-sulfoglucosamine sulfohydrolase
MTNAARFLIIALALTGLCARAHTQELLRRPNILWLSAEDFSADLGCYGDRYADTPNVDRLATQGVRFTRVFTHAPVCAPSRSGLITGMYSFSIGTSWMRCQGVPPPEVKAFPEYLRAAGYYCTNNAKTDYQFAPPITAWDENGNQAHYRKRDKEQPFFAVFNLNVCHESQVRNHTPAMQRRIQALGARKHDPAKAVLPPYYPDTAVVRKDWAQYYDVATLMDQEVGGLLKELDEAGLAEDTIVWFWGDHGRGLPRGKRWPYASGLHVPLIIRVPEKYRKWALPSSPDRLKPGTVNDELVAFVDYAPTMLSLAGVKPPKHLQGQAFLGRERAKPRAFAYGGRDRMDEAVDCIRTVIDGRYQYIRNFMPYLPYSQDVSYMNEMPLMQEWRRLRAEGKLTGPSAAFFRTKPIEELYDLQADPHEIRNLAAEPEHRERLAKLRKELLEWMRETGDVGLVPEAEFDAMKRPGNRMERTARPSFEARVTAGGAGQVRIACATPGSSIAYRLGDETKWRLYTGPLELPPRGRLRAKACRIGFEDSPEVPFPEEGEVLYDPGDGTAHWRTTLDKSGVLKRLLELKTLDVDPKQAVPQYLKALGDPHAAMRYWGLVGVHQAHLKPVSTLGPGLSPGPAELKALLAVRKTVEGYLGDRSPAVRIAAARAICDWGGVEPALPVLLTALKDGPTDSARHQAMVALRQIGQKARPALPEIRVAAMNGSEYVKRVAEYTLRDFGERLPAQ